MNEKHIETSDDLHKRAEFLPVEWRSLLKLDGGKTLNFEINTITTNNNVFGL